YRNNDKDDRLRDFACPVRGMFACIHVFSACLSFHYNRFISTASLLSRVYLETQPSSNRSDALNFCYNYFVSLYSRRAKNLNKEKMPCLTHLPRHSPLWND